MILGLWSGKDEISPLLRPKKVFVPTTSQEQRQGKIQNYELWNRACLHFSNFNEST